MATKSEREFYTKTLPGIKNMLESIFAGRSKQTVSPVNCVAFSVGLISSSGDQFHPTCSHPDRGRQYGCFLTTEGQNGEITLDPQGSCSFQTKNSDPGASDLRERIEEEDRNIF